MADTLYLSLWYPDLRLEALANKLTTVLGAFAAHGGEERVYSATVWPVDWSEAPVFQQIYGRRIQSLTDEQQLPLGALPKDAVAEAMEHLHEDYAWEFQIGWHLWEPEAPGDAGPSLLPQNTDPSTALRSAQDDTAQTGSGSSMEKAYPNQRWKEQMRLVRVIGYGPLFDNASYEAEGHLHIDFGSDAPFLDEDVELDAHGLRYVQQNIQQLLSLASAADKSSGATARLLWSELGENLAEKLSARLGVRN